MKVLFLNAAFRKGSRTRLLAEEFLKNLPADAEIEEVNLGISAPAPLDNIRLKAYLAGQDASDFSDPVFDCAKQFRQADLILIAAPFWNYGLPGVLQNYLELACSQGVTFDMTPEGEYYSMCKASHLVFITTAGGEIPENDNAFGLVRQMATVFWNIKNISYFKADCLDTIGYNTQEQMNAAVSAIRNYRL